MFLWCQWRSTPSKKCCRLMVLRAFTDSTALMKVLSHGLDTQKFLPAVSLPSKSVRGDITDMFYSCLT